MFLWFCRYGHRLCTAASADSACKPHASTFEAAAAGVKRPPVKLPTSLQASELARKREEQLELERRQKKEVLVRQREAARRAVLQKGVDTGKAVAEPVSGDAPPIAAKAEPAMAALPRLKQMIEVRLRCCRGVSLLL